MVEAKYVGLELYLKFTFLNGKTLNVPYSEVIHIRNDFKDNDIFGESPYKALAPLMEVVNTTDQGIVKAIRNKMCIRDSNKIHVFQSFYKWLMNEDLLEDGGCLMRKPKKNPMGKVYKIKEEQRVKRVLSDEQVEIIRCGCLHVRDRAIVEILVATGMRISEPVSYTHLDVYKRQGLHKRKH